MKSLSSEKKRILIKSLLLISLAFYVTDWVYSFINNITFANREECFLYRKLPKLGFFFFEYFIELGILVLLGIFIATLLEYYFSKFKKFYPNNVFTSFLYASILPVCACSAIPLIQSLKNKLSFRNIITFVIAAPLLSPYIIMISLSVLGVEYTILRIFTSFLLAASAGYIVDFFSKKFEIDVDFDLKSKKQDSQCSQSNSCTKNSTDNPCASCNNSPQFKLMNNRDIYLETLDIFIKVMPYILIAGSAGLLMEYFPPQAILTQYIISNNLISLIIVTLIGIPIYFCNGTEVLFIRSMMHSSNFAMGTAIAFSLSSTAICITSIIMLFKFLGKKLTIILTIHLFIVSILIGHIINLFYNI